jgi:hypothetical protein
MDSKEVCSISGNLLAPCGYAYGQTPTFNASPIIASTLAACRRGVQVTLYLDLGFNDQSEMIPFQGGTNEDVVHRMYRALRRKNCGETSRGYLVYCTCTEETRPLNAAIRKRNCHGASRPLYCRREQGLITVAWTLCRSQVHVGRQSDYHSRWRKSWCEAFFTFSLTSSPF